MTRHGAHWSAASTTPKPLLRQPERLLASVARQRELGTADSTAEVLCWRIDRHLPGQPPPPHLHQPTADDIRRYAPLLSASPALTQTLDHQHALTVPAALTTGQHRDVHHDHAATVTTVLGPALAARAQHEPAWPALRAALQRTVHAGHDPATVLTLATRTRSLRTAHSISETLAYRIGTYLTTHPEPLPRDTATGDTATGDADTWRTLAWTLKAAEDNGIRAENVLLAAGHAPHLGDLLTTARTAARPRPQTTGTGPDLPLWLTRPASQPA